MQRRLDIFTPAFQRLVTVVAHNVQYPPDHHEWHQDEVQDFKQARYAIAEALEDAAGKPPKHAHVYLQNPETGWLKSI